MPFDAVDRDLDLPALEARVLARWAEDAVFEESLRRRAGAPEWVFYEGPPTANGRPGIHHVWARSFKDLFPRFHTMRGKNVARKGGWDCHGLPVEVEVEKELGFSGKPQIESFGIAEFNARCRESVHRYVEDWAALTTRIGMWLDTEHAYWTLTNEFIESVWWLFAEMWEKGLISEGFKVVPYCGRCGTALSSHELGQPGAYLDVTEPSVYVRFPVVDGDFDLLVWTTTPWTLVSNVGAAVGSDLDYVRVHLDHGRDVVLAAARVDAIFGDQADIVGPVVVADLVGRHYERPFDWLPVDAGVDAFRVVAADFVTIEDGSGIVHLAPAFGEIDREVGEREGLPVLNPVDAAAQFDPSVPGFAGRFVKEADTDLIDELAAAGKLEQIVDYTHSYPHCWRCGTPLIYWAKPEWFAQTSTRKAELIAQNEAIHWHPEHIKHGRFGDWLENNVDWALSRDRFWGTPIPVWRCDNGHDTCVASVAQLSDLSGRDLAELDLHRPYVDDVEFDCPDCGRRARRVEPVLDAWFDSGSMPSAQFHHPFAENDQFSERFPADFICEAIDQTRGWFYSLLAVNTLVFDQSPYRNVVCLAHIVDKDGQKMSKSKGNVIDPWTILDTRGADALRWYFFSAGSPWVNRRVHEDSIDESTRRFLLTLWNTYSFFVTYANLDAWTPDGSTAQPATTADVHVLDRWLRSRLASTVRDVTVALEEFDALRAAQTIESFVDDLSNWYVRRSRPRFWKASDAAAHATLHESLVATALLLAPFCPFTADELYGNLSGSTDSVHLADWPTADLGAIDDDLEAAVLLAREVVTLGRAARTDAKLKVRQPLRRALVLLPDGVDLPPELVDEVSDELNVKDVEVVRDLEGLLEETVVPNFRRLGPKVGMLMPAVKAALATANATEVRTAFDADGVYELRVEGNATVTVDPDDVEIRASAHEELALAKDGMYAVALDTTLDDDLVLEGVARELVRALNDLRKVQGLALSDRIRVGLRTSGRVEDAARRHGEWIAGEVLAVEWDVDATVDEDDSEAFLLDDTPGRVRLEVVEPT